MIEPGTLDVGKEVVLNFSYEKINRGIITHFNEKFVFVRMYGSDQPKAYKRKFLTWPETSFGANRCVGMF